MSQTHHRKRGPVDRVRKPAANKEHRIAEAERSLSFAREFLRQLDSPDDASRHHIEEIANSLERELDRLRSSADGSGTPTGGPTPDG